MSIAVGINNAEHEVCGELTDENIGGKPYNSVRAVLNKCHINAGYFGVNNIGVVLNYSEYPPAGGVGGAGYDCGNVLVGTVMCTADAGMCDLVKYAILRLDESAALAGAAMGAVAVVHPCAEQMLRSCNILAQISCGKAGADSELAASTCGKIVIAIFSYIEELVAEVKESAAAVAKM